MDVLETLYRRDFVEWTTAQAEVLRRQVAARPDGDPGIDCENLIEEILDSGRSVRRRYRSLPTQHVAHLPKRVHSPTDQPRRPWMAEASTFRIDAKRKADDAQSIRAGLDLAGIRADAGRIAADGMAVDGLDVRDLPTVCPDGLDTQILADGWFPGNRRGTAP
jgi:hypothetical protein